MLSLFDDAAHAGTLLDAAFLHHNIGTILIRLSDFSRGGDHLMKSLAIYDELKLKAGSVRAQWGIGNMLIGTGRFEEGITQLEKIRDDFEYLEMTEDSALVMLDIVEALLASKRSARVLVRRERIG